jgi:hypothetical protein
MSLNVCLTAAAGFFSNPAEVVKTRLQLDGEGGVARAYKGVGDAFAKIIRSEGIRGLQGNALTATICYQSTMNGVRLGMYGPVKRSVADITGLASTSALVSAGSAIITGAVGAFISNPLHLGE